MRETIGRNCARKEFGISLGIFTDTRGIVLASLLHLIRQSLAGIERDSHIMTEKLSSLETT